MEFYVKCDSCGHKQEVEKMKRHATETDHLECNYCPKCPGKDEKEGDYWEEWEVDVDGNTVE